MTALYSILLKIGAFFFMLLAVYKWGSLSVKLKTSNENLQNVIEQSKNLNSNHNSPFLDEPALCLYDKSEDDIITNVSKDAEEISNQAE